MSRFFIYPRLAKSVCVIGFIWLLSFPALNPTRLAAEEFREVAEFLESQVFDGVVEAGARSQISNSVNGTLVSVNFVNGQRVRKGDVLFELDKTAFELDLELARTEVRRREVELDIARDAAARASSLAVAGVATELRKQDAKQALALAEVALREAKAKLDKELEALASATIKAPRSGWIVAPKHDLGAYLKTETRKPLAEILDLETVLVSYLQPYDELIELQGVSPVPMPELLKNLSVFVILPNRTVLEEQGVIVSSDNELDGKGNLRVWARFENPEKTLIPGLKVQAKVLLKE